jgi:hypothetical protein
MRPEDEEAGVNLPMVRMFATVARNFGRKNPDFILAESRSVLWALHNWTSPNTGGSIPRERLFSVPDH